MKATASNRDLCAPVSSFPGPTVKSITIITNTQVQVASTVHSPPDASARGTCGQVVTALLAMVLVLELQLGVLVVARWVVLMVTAVLTSLVMVVVVPLVVMFRFP